MATILFIHQNFPGQFPHLAPALKEMGHKVLAMRCRSGQTGKWPSSWNGVDVYDFTPKRGTTANVHPWIMDIETKTIRGEATLLAAKRLRAEGINPDLIIAHPGWGEAMFVKTVWPNAKMIVYCEFFYSADKGDTGFDPEFPRSIEFEEDASRLKMKAITMRMALEDADAGLAPTHWQASTFPSQFRKSIQVIHDGVDTAEIAPNPNAFLQLSTRTGQQIRLDSSTPVLTFVNRNLEPYRGYHIFMRALPAILQANPELRVILVGGKEVSYGIAPPNGGNWADIFSDELRPKLTAEQWDRIHFVGRVNRSTFTTMLQVSTVHCYLTYPFVLSWSLIEAMSAGCAIVASSTAPVEEVIKHEKTGLLFDFFDVGALAENVNNLLKDPVLRKKLGEQARKLAVSQYDLKTVCLPRQVSWVKSFLGKRQ